MFCHANLLFLVIFGLCSTASAGAQSLAPFHDAPLQARDDVDLSKVADKIYNNDRVSSVTEDRRRWIFAAYVGGAHSASSFLRISQPALGSSLTFEDVSLQSRSFDPPLYYGFRGGYFIPQAPFVGLEAEFIHLKVFSDPQQRVRVAGLRRGDPIQREMPLGDIVQQYSISHGVNLLLFNAALRHGVSRNADAPDGRLVLTARVGVGPTLPHTESSVEGSRQEQYEVGRVGWQVAGGAEFKLLRRMYALGEYKFTRTRQRGKVFSGTAESLLRTHHGVFGLSYHF
jgi:hypothetical protein